MPTFNARHWGPVACNRRGVSLDNSPVLVGCRSQLVRTRSSSGPRPVFLDNCPANIPVVRPQEWRRAGKAAAVASALFVGGLSEYRGKNCVAVADATVVEARAYNFAMIVVLKLCGLGDVRECLWVGRSAGKDGQKEIAKVRSEMCIEVHYDHLQSELRSELPSAST